MFFLLAKALLMWPILQARALPRPTLSQAPIALLLWNSPLRPLARALLLWASSLRPLARAFLLWASSLRPLARALLLWASPLRPLARALLPTRPLPAESWASVPVIQLLSLRRTSYLRLLWVRPELCFPLSSAVPELLEPMALQLWSEHTIYIGLDIIWKLVPFQLGVLLKKTKELFRGHLSWERWVLPVIFTKPFKFICMNLMKRWGQYSTIG